MSSPPVSSLSVASAISYLKQVNPSGDSEDGREGNSLYEHLCRLIATIVAEKPTDPLASFECFSRYVKDVTAPPLLTAAATDGIVAAKMSDEAIQAGKTWAESLRPSIESESSLENSIGQQLVEMPDIFQQMNTLKTAGVGFGDMETYSIYCNMKVLLTQAEGMEWVRFWGKLLGVDNDYWIAEGQADKGTVAGQVDRVGPNRWVYWVKPVQGNEPWTMLGDVTREDIQAASRIQKIVKGDLDAVVISHPWFGGTERRYIRALIATIGNDTVVCPAGYYLPPKDGDEGSGGTESLQMNEEFVYPDNDSLLNEDSWTHCRSDATDEANQSVVRQLDDSFTWIIK
eukprot:GHVQ01032997.1.p1 GENE.GHVQ01032997.1~~GHVQ01032997.1.p1  ORF type:complete len:343 (-),score=65.94 GHVQ01032997.1:85-1113(-)